MNPDRSEELSPGLLQQLERIERLGNAEAEFASAEYERFYQSGQKSQKIETLKLTEAQHSLYTTKARYEREAVRSRQLALVMLCLAPIFTICYCLAISFHYKIAAWAFMLTAGILLGLGITMLYYANKRQQELSDF